MHRRHGAKHGSISAEGKRGCLSGSKMAEAKTPSGSKRRLSARSRGAWFHKPPPVRDHPARAGWRSRPAARTGRGSARDLWPPVRSMTSPSSRSAPRPIAGPSTALDGPSITSMTLGSSRWLEIEGSSAVRSMRTRRAKASDRKGMVVTSSSSASSPQKRRVISGCIKIKPSRLSRGESVDRQRPKERRAASRPGAEDKETAISVPAVRPKTSAVRPASARCSKHSPTLATKARPPLTSQNRSGHFTVGAGSHLPDRSGLNIRPRTLPSRRLPRPGKALRQFGPALKRECGRTSSGSPGGRTK